MFGNTNNWPDNSQFGGGIILGTGTGINVPSVSNPQGVIISSYVGAGSIPSTANFSYQDVALGWEAGFHMQQTGMVNGHNIAIGNSAQQQSGSGIAIGFNAQNASGQGDGTFGNISIGNYAGQHMGGGRNIGIGDFALSSGAPATPAAGNVAIGFNAGRQISTGSQNTIIGNYTTADATPIVTGTGNTIIGANCTAGGDVSNHIVIGTGDGVERLQFDGTTLNWNFTNGPNGNTQFRVGRTANAVNFITAIGGVTGTGVTLTAVNSADANVTLNLNAKGTGGIVFTNGVGGTCARVSTSATTPVNYITLGAANTGVAPFISSLNSADTTAPITYSAKGASSYHSFGTNGAEQFRVSDTASAVNRIKVSGGATGSNATLGALGSDTNVGITVAHQGTATFAMTGQVTQSTVGAAGGASALPATPALYLDISVNGTVYEIPLYTKI